MTPGDRGILVQQATETVESSTAHKSSLSRRRYWRNDAETGYMSRAVLSTFTKHDGLQDDSSCISCMTGIYDIENGRRDIIIMFVWLVVYRSVTLPESDASDVWQAAKTPESY